MRFFAMTSMVYVPKDQISASKKFAKDLIGSIQEEVTAFQPNKYDQSMNIDTILKFALARESGNENRCAVLLCHFDRTLATLDYLSIGDIHMIHISEKGRR